MCLISVCPKGTYKYTEEVTNFIKSGATSNSQGSGFMYKRSGEHFIYVKKGFFDVEKLLEAIKDANLDEDDELVIHHRIATSGIGNRAENTHPFVISENHNEIISLDIKTHKPALVHNGIFSIDQYEKLDRGFSDTYAFTRYIMNDKLNFMLNDPAAFAETYSLELGWSRMALLLPNRDVFMFGDFIEDNGYFHSNGGYKRFVYDRGGSSFNKEVGFPKPYAKSVTTVEQRVLNSINTNPTIPFLKDNNIKLTSDEIKITNINALHFWLFNNRMINPIGYYFESFDDDAIINIAWSADNEPKRRSLPIKGNLLSKVFDYVPRKEFYTFYEEYIEVNKKLKPSKNNLKKLYKLLLRKKSSLLTEQLSINSIEASKLTWLNFFLTNQEQYLNHAVLGENYNYIYSPANDNIIVFSNNAPEYKKPILLIENKEHDTTKQEVDEVLDELCIPIEEPEVFETEQPNYSKVWEVGECN